MRSYVSLVDASQCKRIKASANIAKKLTTVVKSIKAVENAQRIGLRIRNKSRSENHNDIVSLRKLSNNACEIFCYRNK